MHLVPLSMEVVVIVYIDRIHNRVTAPLNQEVELEVELEVEKALIVALLMYFDQTPLVPIKMIIMIVEMNIFMLSTV